MSSDSTEAYSSSYKALWDYCLHVMIAEAIWPDKKSLRWDDSVWVLEHWRAKS